MIELLCKLLLAYVVGVLLFSGLTMFISVMLARWRFSDPDFVTEASADYPGSTASAFFKEWIAETLSYLSMPIGWFDRDAQRNVEKNDEHPPVLFVHGWTENRQNWAWIIRHLRHERSRRLYTVNLSPIDAPVHVYREQLKNRIDAILAQSAHDRLTLIGHSLGGIVSRAYIKEYGSVNIEKLITLGSPHQGTVLAFGAIGRVPRQLEPNSEAIGSLADEKDLEGVDVHSIVTVQDNIVAPFDYGWMPGSVQHIVWGTGHVGMMRCPDVLRIIRVLLYSGIAATEHDVN